MSNLTLNNQSQSIGEQKKSLKLLVFDIEKLTLALPILQIKKVVKYSPIRGSGLSHVGLSHLEEGDITVIDLYRKLFKRSLPVEFQAEGYFILTRNIDGESLGIFVLQPPTLIDIAGDRIRLIPESYRHADTLAIASHVTVVSQDGDCDRTIFILDLARLI